MSNLLRVARFWLTITPALAAASCATALSSPNAAPQAGAGPKISPSGRFGTIVALRPAPPSGDGRDVRASILGVVGGGPVEGADRTSEFVVRTDDGQTVSVMQGDDPALLPGERVVLRGGVRTRIGPLPPGA